MKETQFYTGFQAEELAAVVLASSDATDMERELALQLEAALSYIDTQLRECA